MNIGKARALFEQVASREYHGSTVGECLEAVDTDEGDKESSNE